MDIDDISLIPGHCSPPINCDFDRDMCGWTRDTDQFWIWDHGIGRVENSKALPSSMVYAPKPQTDSDGMFMYTDFTSLTKGTHGEMDMLSEFVPATPGSCLTFYLLVYNFNASNSSFNVVLKDQTGEFSDKY